jgi:hypothetical protein
MYYVVKVEGRARGTAVLLMMRMRKSETSGFVHQMTETIWREPKLVCWRQLDYVLPVHLVCSTVAASDAPDGRLVYHYRLQMIDVDSWLDRPWPR